MYCSRSNQVLLKITSPHSWAYHNVSNAMAMHIQSSFAPITHYSRGHISTVGKVEYYPHIFLKHPKAYETSSQVRECLEAKATRIWMTWPFVGSTQRWMCSRKGASFLGMTTGFTTCTSIFQDIITFTGAIKYGPRS